MTVTSKVRLYDLAKELKQDTKRLIEEVRREGVDVSVPSNSVSKELADKIRNRYFPKKETTAPRAVWSSKKRVPSLKKRRLSREAAATEVAPEPLDIAEAVPPRQSSSAGRGRSRPSSCGRSRNSRPPRAPNILQRAAEAMRLCKSLCRKPSHRPSSSAELSSAPEAATPLPAEQMMEAAARQRLLPEMLLRTPPPAPSRQVRVLRPTAAALNAGVRAWRARSCASAAAAAAVSPRERRERQERARRQARRQAAARDRNNSRAPSPAQNAPGLPAKQPHRRLLTLLRRPMVVDEDARTRRSQHARRRQIA